MTNPIHSLTQIFGTNYFIHEYFAWWFEPTISENLQQRFLHSVDLTTNLNKQHPQAKMEVLIHKLAPSKISYTIAGTDNSLNKGSTCWLCCEAIDSKPYPKCGIHITTLADKDLQSPSKERTRTTHKISDIPLHSSPLVQSISPLVHDSEVKMKVWFIDDLNVEFHDYLCQEELEVFQEETIPFQVSVHICCLEESVAFLF